MNGAQVRFYMSTWASDGPAIKARHWWTCRDTQGLIDTECNQQDGTWPSRENSTYQTALWESNYGSDYPYLEEDHLYVMHFRWSWKIRGEVDPWTYPDPNYRPDAIESFPIRCLTVGEDEYGPIRDCTFVSA